MALENYVQAAVIDTLTNQSDKQLRLSSMSRMQCREAMALIRQTTQALVYVPNAVSSGREIDNLVPLGEVGKTTGLHLESIRAHT